MDQYIFTSLKRTHCSLRINFFEKILLIDDNLGFLFFSETQLQTEITIGELIVMSFKLHYGCVNKKACPVFLEKLIRRCPTFKRPYSMLV